MSTDRPRRIGVYGGAFDPPHMAHFALAQAAIAQYALDRLVVLPLGQAWYKTRALSAAAHRIAMARLNFDGLVQAQVDPRETVRSGHSYTIDTLLELRVEHPGAELFLLMGADQLRFFPRWHRYQEILRNATLLVASRAESVPTEGQNDAEKQGKIDHLDIQTPDLPISATQIRQLCAQDQPIDHLVKPAVSRYIAKQRLYSNSSKTT